MTTAAETTTAEKALVIVGCTTVAENYLVFARVLAQSWRRWHPGKEFFVLVLDVERPAALGLDGVHALSMKELGLSDEEIRTRRAIYGPLELATSLKPRLMRFLIEQGADAVIFVDPDTEIFAGIDDVGVAATKHGVVLTPHVVDPMPFDGLGPTEADIQVSGIFNTGLMAVGRSADGFLTWWDSRLARHCLIDPDAELYVDQRWVDWVSSCFEHLVLRDRTLNVAFWNLHERPLTLADGRYLAHGAPLRHFHFSGFDPLRPDLVTTYLPTRPFRVRLNEQPALARLLEEYAARVIAAGYQDARTHPYGFGKSADGVPLGRWARTVYREAVLASGPGPGRNLPDPFDPAETERFQELIRDPGTSDLLPARVRARLEQERELMGEDSWRQPSSRWWRVANRIRGRLGHMLRAIGERSGAGTERRRRRAVDQALLEYIDDVDRRVDGVIADLRRSPSGGAVESPR